MPRASAAGGGPNGLSFNPSYASAHGQTLSTSQVFEAHSKGVDVSNCHGPTRSSMTNYASSHPTEYAQSGYSIPGYHPRK